MAKSKKESKELSFKDFRLEQIVFETRYTCKKYYQDKHIFRAFWNEIQSKLNGELKLIEEGEITVLRYKKKFEIQVSQDRFAVIEFYPKSTLDEFLEIAKMFFDTTLTILEVEELKRIGLRSIYTKDYNDAKLIAAALLNTKYINFPENIYSLKDGNAIIPNYAIGWRNGEQGISYRLGGKSEVFSIDLPTRLVADGEKESIKKVYNQVLFDVDIYLHDKILLGQFFVEEWIKQTNTVSKKEGEKFFGGK